VIMRDGSLVEVQGTGEQGVFSREELDSLLDASAEGIKTIMAKQTEALERG